MKRRDFFKYSVSALTLPVVSNALDVQLPNKHLFPTDLLSTKFDLYSKETFIEPPHEEAEIQRIEEQLKATNVEDKFLDTKNLKEFNSVKNKLAAVQNHIGYGNFNILSFDDMLKVAKSSSKIGKFTKKELEFFESIFYYDPSYHGFYGRQISDKITQVINKKEVIKIPKTGHYLFKGEPEATYYKMVDDVGPSLTLTSGVRSIVKQSKLFLDKIASVEGNLTVASRSLAPPAFTYHSISDFDVGKKGFGKANFSSRFAFTKEFSKMRKLKYIDMRYTINNKDGVRYEPWHVKII